MEPDHPGDGRAHHVLRLDRPGAAAPPHPALRYGRGDGRPHGAPGYAAAPGDHRRVALHESGARRAARSVEALDEALSTGPGDEQVDSTVQALVVVRVARLPVRDARRRQRLSRRRATSRRRRTRRRQRCRTHPVHRPLRTRTPASQRPRRPPRGTCRSPSSPSWRRRTSTVTVPACRTPRASAGPRRDPRTARSSTSPSRGTRRRPRASRWLRGARLATRGGTTR